MESETKKKMKNQTTTTTMTTSSSSPDRNPSDETLAIPKWKFYENPFYNSQQNHQTQNQTAQTQNQNQSLAKSLQFLHLPVSARKIAASIWDLTLFKPASMESELAELRSELDRERKSRKKLEGANRRIANELASAQSLCDDLARQVSADRAELARLRREIDEERKMLRVSEILREERVQMKLADAKIALEERLSELDDRLRMASAAPRAVNNNLSWKFRHFVLGDKFSESVTSVSGDRDKSLSVSDRHQYERGESDVSNKYAPLPNLQRKMVSSSESENPHIKRGIKGFVEFPRVVRSIGTTKNRQWGTKLECQKAQLRIFLKQKSSPLRSSNNLIMS